ncbi:hypothetical protein ABIE91_001225 [Bradyrhizobium elkanii]|nr:hypothetical protein [Bradyrhizobium elkanii]
MNKRMGTDGGLSRFQPDGELTIWGTSRPLMSGIGAKSREGRGGLWSRKRDCWRRQSARNALAKVAIAINTVACMLNGTVRS